MAFHRPNPNDKPTPLLKGGLGAMVEAEKLMHIAFVLPSAVLIGWLGGSWADQKFHQKWIMIAGILFGCVSGLVYVIQQAILTEKKSIAEENTDPTSEEKTGNSKIEP